MHKHETLFYWSMIDLEACTRTSYLYHTMRIPGLLRLLMTDNPRAKKPLLPKVAPLHSLDVRFHVAGARSLGPGPKPPNGSVTAIIIGPVPDEPPGLGISPPLTAEQLVEWVPLQLNGIPISVLDLLEHVAYVSGLTHAGTPDPRRLEKDKLLLEWRRSRLPGTKDPVLRLIAGIGRVAHRGLTPLLERVHERLFGAGPIARFHYEPPYQDKSRQADGSWLIRAEGCEIRVTTGVFAADDAVHVTTAVEPGAPFVQFESGDRVWRAYNYPGVKPPDLASASIMAILNMLAGEAIRVR